MTLLNKGRLSWTDLHKNVFVFWKLIYQFYFIKIYVEKRES